MRKPSKYIDGFETFISLKSNINALTSMKIKVDEILEHNEAGEVTMQSKPMLISSVSAGLGKTHLLRAFSQELRHFSNFYTYADRIDSFSKKDIDHIIHQDILLVEDIYTSRHILNKKFKMIINSFYQKGKPVLVSLCERNISSNLFVKAFPYFASNIIILKELDYEDRVKIYFEFREKFTKNLFSDKELIKMAKRTRQNIRDIEGKFQRKAALLRKIDS